MCTYDENYRISGIEILRAGIYFKDRGKSGVGRDRKEGTEERRLFFYKIKDGTQPVE